MNVLLLNIGLKLLGILARWGVKQTDTELDDDFLKMLDAGIKNDPVLVKEVKKAIAEKL